MPEKKSVYVVVYNDFNPFQTNLDVFSTMEKAVEQIEKTLSIAIEEQTSFEEIVVSRNAYGVLVYFAVKLVGELSYECFIRKEVIQ